MTVVRGCSPAAVVCVSKQHTALCCEHTALCRERTALCREHATVCGGFAHGISLADAKQWTVVYSADARVVTCQLWGVPAAHAHMTGSLTNEIRQLLNPLQAQGLLTITPFTDILQYEVWAEGQVSSRA